MEVDVQWDDVCCGYSISHSCPDMYKINSNEGNGNEDEFFAATKKELALLWHAPYYHDTELIRTYGNTAGYEYVSAFSKFSDRTTYERSQEKAEPYKSASEIINGMIEGLEDGMIIPVYIGKANGTRKDYLYEKLDLLIAAILESGYEITDVQGLK